MVDAEALWPHSSSVIALTFLVVSDAVPEALEATRSPSTGRSTACGKWGPGGRAAFGDAARIRCPVLFLMQLEDELFPRDGYLAVFDALASDDKRIHANPGLHPAVPAEEIATSFAFIERLVGRSR